MFFFLPSHMKIFYFPGMKVWVHMFWFVKSLFYANLAAYFLLSEYIIPQINKKSIQSYFLLSLDGRKGHWATIFSSFYCDFKIHFYNDIFCKICNLLLVVWLWIYILLYTVGPQLSGHQLSGYLYCLATILQWDCLFYINFHLNLAQNKNQNV